METISGALFLAGTTIVAILRNVPLNDQLRDANHQDTPNPLWTMYLDKWLFWNHIRTTSAILSGFFLVI
jgi:uncharacterized membrane protein